MTAAAEAEAHASTAPFDPEVLPEQMRNARRWLLWKLEPSHTGGKDRKVPYYCSGRRRMGTLDDPTDIRRLATLERALEAFSAGSYSGLGFALGPDGSGGYWQGIDLDGIPDRPELRALVKQLPGYVEKSPSGRGCHAIGYGRQFTTLGSNGAGVEAYSKARYFTMTGNVIEGRDPVCIADFVERLLAPMHSQRQDRSAGAKDDGVEFENMVGDDTIRDLRSALNAIPADDRDVWIRMGMALKKLGNVGRGLWLDWSATSEKHEPADDAQTWDTLKPERTGYRVVFAEAQRHGWLNPRRGAGCQSDEPGDDSSEPGNGNRDSSRRKFNILTGDDLDGIPPIAWLVKGLIPRTGLGVIWGPSGCGKSFLALDLAAHIADGERWFGYRVKPAPVLYVGLEGAAGVPNRKRAWERENERPMSSDVRFLLEPFRVINAKDVEALAPLCARQSVVIIDTAARSAPGIAENESQGMGQIIDGATKLADAIDGLVLLVAHTGKDAARGIRGHYSLFAAIDTGIEVVQDGERRWWTSGKVKDGEADKQHAFDLDVVELGLDDDLDTITSCVAVPSTHVADRMPRLTPEQGRALDTYFEAAGEVGRVDPEGGFAGLYVEDWRPYFYRSSTLDQLSSKRQAFNRHRSALVEKGRLEVVDDVYRPAGPTADAHEQEFLKKLKARRGG